jgi:T-complex protein 1 subunit theta
MPSIHRVVKPKVAIFACPLDTQQSDTKGTVLLKSAKELMNYTKTEKNTPKESSAPLPTPVPSTLFIPSLIVVGGSISDICLHYAEKFKLMVVKVQSKFELRRLCKCLNAAPLARLGAPNEEEMGTCDEVYVSEIGSQKVTIFKRDSEDCRLATLVLRGSTNNLLDDIERAVDDAVNTFKSLLKD